jgi:hypothetical protein
MRIVSLFYDYVDINEVNIVKAWLDRRDPRTKAKLTTRLNALEQMNRPEWNNTGWTGVLKGDKDGWIAVKAKSQGIQYRLLGYDGPNRGEFTILACGTEHNDRYIPLDIGSIASGRMAAVEANPIVRRTPHDFG